MESLEHTRLNWAPHMQCKDVLGIQVDNKGRALAYFRKIEEADNELACALARGREFTNAAISILFAPCAPLAKGANPPKVAPDCNRRASDCNVVSTCRRCCSCGVHSIAVFWRYVWVADGK